MHDPQRREAVLAEAVRVGKFTADRLPHYRTMYDRDPAGTEAAINALHAVGAAVLGNAAAASTELRTQAQHVNPVAPPRPAAGVELSPALVGKWSGELFPEAVAAGAKPGRIMSDQRYSRVHAPV
jgi:hypothetical protein